MGFLAHFEDGMKNGQKIFYLPQDLRDAGLPDHVEVVPLVLDLRSPLVKEFHKQGMHSEAFRTEVDVWYDRPTLKYA